MIMPEYNKLKEFETPCQDSIKLLAAFFAMLIITPIAAIQTQLRGAKERQCTLNETAYYDHGGAISGSADR
jgi:hypothetical protein